MPLSHSHAFSETSAEAYGEVCASCVVSRRSGWRDRRRSGEANGSAVTAKTLFAAPMLRQLKRGLKCGPRAAVAVRFQNQNPRRVPERRSQTVSGQQIKFMNVRVSIELATRVGGDSR